MKKVKIPRWLIVSACLALALCAALLFEYQRHLVKPFYRVAPFARREITGVALSLREHERLELDGARAEELLEVFENCQVKLKSSDGWFTDHYGSVFVTTSRDPFPREVMLSEQGVVGFSDGNGRIAVYYIVEGGEELDRCIATIGK